jgi:hypothetical protein
LFLIKFTSIPALSFSKRWSLGSGQACGGKTSSRCARPSVFLPERHADFTRASLPRLPRSSNRWYWGETRSLFLRGRPGKAVQKKFGVLHPLRGTLLEKMVLKSGTAIDAIFDVQPSLW